MRRKGKRVDTRGRGGKRSVRDIKKGVMMGENANESIIETAVMRENLVIAINEIAAVKMNVKIDVTTTMMKARTVVARTVIMGDSARRIKRVIVTKMTNAKTVVTRTVNGVDIAR